LRGSIASRAIFPLPFYLNGKSAKEIQQIASISENTLKYHNKGIYSKLGVSSRKQLLQCAALMKQRGELPRACSPQKEFVSNDFFNGKTRQKSG